jgi:uridine phosphorylase
MTAEQQQIHNDEEERRVKQREEALAAKQGVDQDVRVVYALQATTRARWEQIATSFDAQVVSTELHQATLRFAPGTGTLKNQQVMVCSTGRPVAIVGDPVVPPSSTNGGTTNV